MKSYKVNWEMQEKLQTCEERLEESLQCKDEIYHENVALLAQVKKLQNYVAIYEHAEKFAEEKASLMAERVKSLSNEAIDIMRDYLKFYKTDYVLSAHKIKSENNTQEYVR